MKENFKFSFLILFIFILNFRVYAQNVQKIDFSEKIKGLDISTIISSDSTITIFEANKMQVHLKREEPLGFIGDNYQRFFIHFISIIKNPSNPLIYLVYGKTRVKENICPFQGTITIEKAETYNSSDITNFKQGFAICELTIFEDNKLPSTGQINGKLKVEFLADNRGQIKYDTSNFEADGFANNQFVGNWSSYKTKIIKKCNWGDYRIPECGDLDIGAGEFIVSDKYLNNGWESFKLASGYKTSSNSSSFKESKMKETQKWWK
jgi:hypothetical protein